MRQQRRRQRKKSKRNERLWQIKWLRWYPCDASFRDFDVKSYIKLTLEFDNKGTKTITGINGIATIKDKFGDTVSERPIKVEQEIPAGKNVTIILQTTFNQFDNDDRRLANLDAVSAKLTLSPEVVLFSDGTKFEAPKTKE